MTEGSATIVAPAPDCSVDASVTWTADSTTIRDGNGRTTVLRHGSDVETLALRRTPPPDGSAPGAVSTWTLDLMQGSTSRARLHSPPWDFDREHGPVEAARVSGLPLVQRAPALDSPPAPVDPRPHGSARRLVLATVIVVPLLYCLLILVPPLRENAWSWAFVTALSLPVLLWVRVPPLVRRLGLGGRDEVVFRARPSADHGSSSGATLVRHRGLTLVRTRRRSYPLPPLGDACGPAELRPADHGDGGPTHLLLVRAASGHPLATLLRSEWCADGSEAELAAAIGVPFDPAPVPADPRSGVASVMDRVESPGRLVVLVSLTGPVALASGLSTDQGLASGAAIVVGALNTVLGIGTMIVLLVAEHWRGRPGARRTRQRS
ncbi:MAG: hypothetical protein ABWX74_15425 [Aeromicrobium sp.]